MSHASRMLRVKTATLVLSLALGLAAIGSKARAEELQTAIVAGGCFWCVESDFDSVPGVVETISGFAGGTVPNPTYKEVSHGGTGHFEAEKITYDAEVLSYRALLDLFLRSIDPTDAGGQFCDRGDTYRTAIFVSSDEERADAEAALEDASAALGQPLVTEVLDATDFWPADDSHQNYHASDKLTLTRFGIVTRATAYARYRKACGRDARVLELWGDAAPFVH